MAKDSTKPAPTRDGFGEGLVELGKTNKDVVVLSADLTDSTRAAWFKRQFPDRFFALGVAEQDMIGTAAGFALMGKIPFACTFGVFASGRAWDQIRVSVAYMDKCEDRRHTRRNLRRSGRRNAPGARGDIVDADTAE